MRFIDNKKKIIREIIKNSVWWFTRQSVVEVERIVLNSVYKSRLFDHSDIIFYSFFYPFCFYEHSLFLKFFHSKLFFSVHLFKNCIYIRDILEKLCSWPKGYFMFIFFMFKGQRVFEFNQFKYFFVEMESVDKFFCTRKNIQNISFEFKHSVFYLGKNRFILHMEELFL